MVIPSQLQHPEFRFVLIKPQTKSPIEYNWQIKNNYPYTHRNILTHKGNVGVVCGFGGLVVIDIDNKDYIEEFDNLQTFSVKTGSGGRHYYFICKEKFEKSIYILNGSVGELRVKNSQVLIPSSIHPNGNNYEVCNNVDILCVGKKFIRELLGELLIKDKNNGADCSRSGQDWREVCEMIEGGYNFDEVNMEMGLIGSSRWNNETLSYKLTTYCNALKQVKQKIYK